MMKRNVINVLFLGVLLSAVFMPANASGQMEKRRGVLYHQMAFEKAFPAIGQKAPELEVRSMDGEVVRLSDYLGKRLIVVKGSYT